MMRVHSAKYFLSDTNAFERGTFRKQVRGLCQVEVRLEQVHTSPCIKCLYKYSYLTEDVALMKAPQSSFCQQTQKFLQDIGRAVEDSIQAEPEDDSGPRRRRFREEVTNGESAELVEEPLVVKLGSDQ